MTSPDDICDSKYSIGNIGNSQTGRGSSSLPSYNLPYNRNNRNDGNNRNDKNDGNDKKRSSLNIDDFEYNVGNIGNSHAEKGIKIFQSDSQTYNGKDRKDSNDGNDVKKKE